MVLNTTVLLQQFLKVISFLVQQALTDCINAENIDADLDTYRNKMMYIQKLNVMESNQFSKQCSDFILRFLIGNLFVNFSVLWEPITKVIVSHATKDNEDFWDIWKAMLHAAALFCSKCSDYVSLLNIFLMRGGIQKI